MSACFHFAPENPEDGEMYILVPAHPVGCQCPGQGPESCKMVLCACVRTGKMDVWCKVTR